MKFFKNWLLPCLTAVLCGILLVLESMVIKNASTYAVVMDAFGEVQAFPVLYHLACGMIATFALFFVYFASFRWKLKVYLPVSFASSIAFLALWAILIGFYRYTESIVVSVIVFIVMALFLFGKKIGRRGIVCAATVLILSFSVSFPLYFLDKVQQAKRIETVPLAAYDNPTTTPYAKAPSKLYVYTWDSENFGISASDFSFLQSIQGYLSLTSEEQIFFHYYRKEAEDDQLATMQKYYNLEIEEVATASDLLDCVSGRIQNYILCDGSSLESITVGLSLCHQMDAVLVPQDKLSYAQKYHWNQVFSTVGKDKYWLMESPYFNNLNKNLCIVSTEYIANESHCDYAVLSNAWFVTQFTSQEELALYASKMNRGFYLWGIRGTYLTENAVVTTVASYSGTYFYSWGMSNVSVLSGFRLENTKTAVTPITRETTVTDFSKTEIKNKHTVTIMVSDGDNMQFTAENNLFNKSIFGNPDRTEDVSINYGMSGLMIKLLPLMLLSYYDKIYPNESLVMQLSSIGYTYPSKWADEEAFAEVLKSLFSTMETADIHLVELMDDISFMGAVDVPSQFDTMQKYFDLYTESDQVDGLLFISYQSCYDGYKGEMCWSNDKPVVSARYCIWSEKKGGDSTNSLQYIADSINAASTDVTSEDAYSFIIVHAWSGLDADGNLVSANGGEASCMNAMLTLAEMFDDDVDVVNCDEFIARIRQYVEH